MQRPPHPLSVYLPSIGYNKSARWSEITSEHPRLTRLQLHAGVTEYVGNVAVLVDRRSVPGTPRRWVVVVVVVVNVVRWLSHARRGGHHRDGLVIPELAAASAALQDGDEAAPVFLVEECVEDWIYAGVAGTQPLGNRRGDRQDLVLSLRHVAAQLDHGEDYVKRQPWEDEEYHNHDQHLDHLHLRLLLYPLHLGVFGIGGYMPAPHLNPDKNVAKRYEYHRQHVAKSQIANQEEQRAILGVRPRFQAKAQVGIVIVDGDQVEEQQPGRRHCQSDEPDHNDHHACSPFCDLTFQRPPDRQKPEKCKPQK